MRKRIRSNLIIPKPPQKDISVPRIVAIEETNGRLMVELERPSGDGHCRILSQEEDDEISRLLQQRIALLDACRAVDAEQPPYIGPSWETALKMVSDALAEVAN